MSRVMYDACDPQRIPADAAMVAGYLYGPCAWQPWAWALHPNAVHVRIATVARLDAGEVLDVESGDASPELAVQWCARARQRGQDPTVYCNVATWPAVREQFATHDVPLPHFWIADWDHGPIIPAGAVAVQYENDKATGYDVSLVSNYWPGVDPAPQPIPEVGPMHLFVVPIPAGVWCLFENSGRYAHVTSQEDIDALEAAGATKPQPLSPAQHAVFLATFIVAPGQSEA